MSGKESEKQIKRFRHAEEIQHHRKCNKNEGAKIFKITVNGYSTKKFTIVSHDTVITPTQFFMYRMRTR
jgi:hypothetical protein